MRVLSRLGAQALLIMAIGGGHAGATESTLTGTALYRERIDRAHSYDVRGRTLVDRRLWFTTTETYLVLTQRRDDHIELFDADGAPLASSAS
jgi:uncharacterized lipoprotein YbaY